MSTDYTCRNTGIGVPERPCGYCHEGSCNAEVQCKGCGRLLLAITHGPCPSHFLLGDDGMPTGETALLDEGTEMTQHLHSTHVEGCFRCELSQDELDGEILEAINEELDRLVLRRSALTFARLRHGYVLQREET